MRGSLFIVLALAGCSPSATKSPGKTEGEAQKIRMDAATTTYSDCITGGARNVDVDNDAAGSVANRVVLACKDQRNALMADVAAFHQIGHPKFSIAQSRAVAEASIATIEDELRQQAVVTVVTRQLATGTATTAKPIGTQTDKSLVQPKVTF